MKRRLTKWPTPGAVVVAAAMVAPLVLTSSPASAQHVVSPHAGERGAAIDARVGAHIVPLITHVSPILAGSSKTEVYLTQPTLLGTASAFDGGVRAHAAISLEALTLDRGELGAGAYGEGYVDRRHPHTWLHELVVTVQGGAAGAIASLTAGRGFAPFGTDDPMMRPFVKFPVNHHLGQVLERLIVVGGVSAGPVLLEGGLFNGNEPVNAEDLGSLERFGDSWSARVTLLPVSGLELQASRAWIVSPEFPRGGGWDQRKWSASVRYGRERAIGAVYGLLEWNRTTEVDRGSDVFSFGSLLAEAGVDVGGWRPALRVERAERPEEERLADPFRTRWPHAGGHVLGITQWTNIAARIERTASAGSIGAAPFVEVSMANVSIAADGLFDPREFYGSNRIWTASAGVRMRAGWHPARMGRYGVATIAAPTHEH